MTNDIKELSIEEMDQVSGGKGQFLPFTILGWAVDNAESIANGTTYTDTDMDWGEWDYFLW